MLDNLLNSIALTAIVAIAAAAASVNFQTPEPKAPGLHATHAAAAASAVEGPMTVVQLPTVVVVGHRERAPEPVAVAAAN